MPGHAHVSLSVCLSVCAIVDAVDTLNRRRTGTAHQCMYNFECVQWPVGAKQKEPPTYLVTSVHSFPLVSVGLSARLSVCLVVFAGVLA